ncbi:MAG TPA: OsmC family protein [Candidatus Omnitrophota bacterium]|nr:OsmC family protein [Candidatus Omnitrophota bacterium]HPD85478.1 OsmC family protein [Candidatus Omnitrophota bacterium]HRZ04021.1 OsmC family protein [Candidatus Omnitrophota bacterium]
MEERRVRPKKFFYRSTLQWQNERKAILSSAGKPSLEVTPPPEFKGPDGFWTPEDLLVAAANSCFLMTFLAYAERDQIALAGYEGEAEGVLELVDRKMIVTQIKLIVRISLKSSSDIPRAEAVLKSSKENCIISNSVKSSIDVESQITVAH